MSRIWSMHSLLLWPSSLGGKCYMAQCLYTEQDNSHWLHRCISQCCLAMLWLLDFWQSGCRSCQGRPYPTIQQICSCIFLAFTNAERTSLWQEGPQGCHSRDLGTLLSRLALHWLEHGCYHPCAHSWTTSTSTAPSLLPSQATTQTWLCFHCRNLGTSFTTKPFAKTTTSPSAWAWTLATMDGTSAASQVDMYPDPTSEFFPPLCRTMEALSTIVCQPTTICQWRPTQIGWWNGTWFGNRQSQRNFQVYATSTDGQAGT